MLLALSAAVLLAAFTGYNICQPRDQVPFKSRFLYLLSLLAMMTCLNTCLMLSSLSAERGPTSSSLIMTSFRGGLRAMRVADAISDGMLVRSMLEKVCTMALLD